MVAIETKLNELNEALIQTEKMLEKSRAEIRPFIHSWTLFAHKQRPPLPDAQPRIPKTRTAGQVQ